MYKQLLSSASPAWRAAVEFHGHACPGVAIGCRMALAAITSLKLDPGFLMRSGSAFEHAISPDEELVCITETDACCVDAVQALLGCTLGKGNLLLKLRGKTAMSFYHRPAGTAVRIIWFAEMHNPDLINLSRHEKMDYILTAPEENLLKVQEIPFNPPSRALIARSLICSKCGEMTAEYAIHLHNGLPFCDDCYPDNSRIL